MIGAERPRPSATLPASNDYVFERLIAVNHMDGRRTGRIDLYKRGAFVLEAKQSHRKMRRMIRLEARHHITDYYLGPRSGVMRGWDLMMLNARHQAETYARALATFHGMPPFVMTCDIGLCIDVFARKDAHYARFPDTPGSRIFIEDLRKAHLRDRLHRIWMNPLSLLT